MHQQWKTQIKAKGESHATADNNAKTKAEVGVDIDRKLGFLVK